MSWIEDWSKSYWAWKNRQYQQKIFEEESRAALRKLKAGRKPFEEAGAIRGNWVVKEVKVDRKVEKKIEDATEQELLETYGSSIYVYACCNAIAEKGASILPQLVNEEGEVQKSDEILNKILHPNPTTDFDDLLELTHLWLDLSGDAYWYFTKEGYIQPLRPTKMRVVPDKDNQIVGYAYKVKGYDGKKGSNGDKITKEEFANRLGKDKNTTEKDIDDFEYTMRVARGQEGLRVAKGLNKDDWIPFEPEEIVHFKYAHPYNDFYGMSPLQSLLLSVETDLYARSWNKRFFEQGALPLGVITIPEIIDPKDFKDMQEEFEKKHEGERKAHKPLWLMGGTEYKVIEPTHQDLEFLRLIQLNREDILSAYGVPPVMVALFSFSNSSGRSAGIEEQRKIFWQDTLIPKIKKIYGQINLHFYKDTPYHLEPDLSSIEALMPNWNERAKGAKDAIVSGLSIPEVRRIFFNLGDTDEPIYLPMGLVPTINGEMQIQPEQEQPEQPEEEGKTIYQPVNTRLKKKEENRRVALWRKFDTKVVPQEDEFFKFLKGLFKEQEERVLASLKVLWYKAVSEKAPEDVLDIFDYDVEVEDFIDESGEIYTSLLNQNGQAALDEVGVGLNFNMDDTNVQAALDNHQFRFASEVNRTTQDALRSQLSDGIADGESIDQIAKRIRGVFAGTVRGTAPRARRIARTEITGIANGGAMIGYEQSEIVKRKEWLSSRDNRTRDWHLSMDSQKRNLDRPFTSGLGNALMYPGDPGAPPEDVINCRCTVLPIVKEGPSSGPGKPPKPEDEWGEFAEFKDTVGGDIENPQATMQWMEDRIDHLLSKLKDDNRAIFFVKGSDWDNSNIVKRLNKFGKTEFADHVKDVGTKFKGLEGISYDGKGILVKVKGKMKPPSDYMTITQDLWDSGDFTDHRPWTLSWYNEAIAGEQASIHTNLIHELGHQVDDLMNGNIIATRKKIRKEIYEDIAKKRGVERFVDLRSEMEFKEFHKIIINADRRIERRVKKSIPYKWKEMNRDRGTLEDLISMYQGHNREGASEALAGYVFENDVMKNSFKKDFDLIEMAFDFLGIDISPNPVPLE